LKKQRVLKDKKGHNYMDDKKYELNHIKTESYVSKKIGNILGDVPLEVIIISVTTIIFAIIPIVTLAYENSNSSESGWIAFIFLPIIIFFSLFPIAASLSLFIRSNFSRIFYVIIAICWILINSILFYDLFNDGFFNRIIYSFEYLLNFFKLLFLLWAVVYLLFSKKSKNFFLKQNQEQ